LPTAEGAGTGLGGALRRVLGIGGGVAAEAGASMDRLATYQAIENLRKRPLIVYATSTRPNVRAAMGGDAVREFIDQMDLIPRGERAVDVLLHSSGGDPLAAWKLMSVLRERFASVAVLVPYMAFSAATLFSLGADEILMHPHASLGPIDPQITVFGKDREELHFSYEDVGAFLRFLKSEVGLSDQGSLAEIVDKLFSTLDPLKVGYAQRASELSTDVGERLLKLHESRGAPARDDARSIAERLNKAFFAHGDAVSRTRARELGLAVIDPDPELEAAMWAAFLALESAMELRDPFNPLDLLRADKAAAEFLQPPAPLRLAPNTPMHLVEQAFQAHANAALQTAQRGSGAEVRCRLCAAVVESTRLQRAFIQELALTGVRMGLEIKVAVTAGGGWQSAGPGGPKR
jgi:hypothetical protein